MCPDDFSPLAGCDVKAWCWCAWWAVFALTKGQSEPATTIWGRLWLVEPSVEHPKNARLSLQMLRTHGDDDGDGDDGDDDDDDDDDDDGDGDGDGDDDDDDSDDDDDDDDDDGGDGDGDGDADSDDDHDHDDDDYGDDEEVELEQTDGHLGPVKTSLGYGYSGSASPKLQPHGLARGLSSGPVFIARKRHRLSPCPP
eukprot:s1127_g15.t1